jgi:hypothetical protein
VLIYRLSGQGRGRAPLEKWRCLVRLCALSPADVDTHHTAEISLAAWLQFIAETTHPPQEPTPDA